MLTAQQQLFVQALEEQDLAAGASAFWQMVSIQILLTLKKALRFQYGQMVCLNGGKWSVKRMKQVSP